MTGVTPIYTPDVVGVQKSTDTVVVTVACLAGDAWAQAENGEMDFLDVQPDTAKFRKLASLPCGDNFCIRGKNRHCQRAKIKRPPGQVF